MIGWAPECQTVSQNCCLEVPTKFRERLKTKRLELWRKKSQILHEGSAPADNALSGIQFLGDRCSPVLDHLP